MHTPMAPLRRSTILIGGDLMMALFTLFAVFWLYHGKVDSLGMTWREFSPLAVMFALLYLVAIYMWDGYSLTLPINNAKQATSMVGASGTLIVLLALIGVVSQSLFLGRRFFLTYPLLVALTETIWRMSASRLIPQLTSYEVVAAGESNRTIRLAEEIRSREHLGYKFQGFLTHDRKSFLIGNGGQIAAQAETEVFAPAALAFDELKSVVVDPDTVDEIPVRTLISWRMNGIRVMDCQDFLEDLTGKLDVQLLGEKWLMVSPGFVRSRWRLLVKRIIDLVLAVSIGVLALPLGLITAIAIKLESRGPLFYVQERVGLNNKVFRIIKFRSMRDDAEKRTGPVFAAEQDPRITRVGKIIRRSRIDELPQLINVIRGEMSMIGPRPERPEFVSTLSSAIPLYEYRHSMKPGLTGWAQICYPYGAGLNDSREKLGFDLYYLKNWSLVFDAQILLHTCKVVLFGRGAR